MRAYTYTFRVNTGSFEEALRRRVLVLDGAMGTMIQRHDLTEDDFRGSLEVAPGVRLKGCNDVLSVTRPDVIRGIHRAYIDAGADIVETNSFNANAVSMAEYGLVPLVAEINRAAASLARAEADAEMARSGRRVWVAGSVGPSNVALSIAGAGGDVSFDAMADAYEAQCRALIAGGVDTLLLETVFDTLNAKAAILGARRAIGEADREVPLMISVTLTEQGRTLSGQTVRAFLDSVSHAGAVSIGLNCGFGAEGMEPWLRELQEAPCFISLHPNAGLPDELGRYTQTPEVMAATMRRYLEAGLLNMAGGCCGTTPEHIRAIADVAREAAPRRVPEADGSALRLSGLESCHVSAETGFVKVGERCNVAGSRKFLRLVNEGKLPEALEVAAAQVAKGARVLDVNMDDGMLDAPAEMEKFVTLLGADAVTSPLPVMIDSSDMEVIRRALRRIQGRPIVNSISLKGGEEAFLDHAREIRSLGGAVVVMAFDEKGQATDFDRRVEICSRAYRLLTQEAGFRGCDIVFDPNVLTIATGVADHDRYALDFLEAVEWIKSNLPGAKVSGGVSNLSFAFRGHDRLREAMHTVFLHHAILRGMDMAIVNPSTSTDISTVAPDVREAVEDLIFCRRADATDRLLEIAARMREEAERRKAAAGASPAKKAPAAAAPTIGALVEKGLDAGIEPLLDEALAASGSAMQVVKGPLMEAMQKVGDEFGAGRMFLPQVVRSASVMKRAIEYLTPALEAEAAARGADDSSAGEKFVLATVKGDVHDIGKNIVGVILRCSGFEVIDLGVMVEPSAILEAVKRNGARFLGLSGLITPSLSEMCEVAAMLEREGLKDVNLFVGGATTSDLHTAVKIAPLFEGLTLHTRDAAQLPPLAAALADPARRAEEMARLADSQEALREDFRRRQEQRAEGAAAQVPSASAHPQVVTPVPAPRHPGLTDLKVSIADIVPLINWRAFLHTWGLSPALAPEALDDGGESADAPACDCGVPHHHHAAPRASGHDPKALDEARRLIRDARGMLDELAALDVRLDARVVLLPARREGDDIVIRDADGERVVIPTLRREEAPALAMADFLSDREDDWVGLFAVTARPALEALTVRDGSYRHMLLQSLADRLVEGATEWMHSYEHESLHGLDTPRGIRPAIGYPSLPDQSLVFVADRLLHYSELGIQLTGNGALYPSATTTGLIFAAPGSRYFEIGRLGEGALSDYARRRGLTPERLKALLPSCF
ncbi:MAG: methionine synthase [Muribaculaceae bacterium]|nr:methionine synthase [Muribaculaceae bacterium]